MKSCPKCNRTFPDEGQKFCTFDGGLLIAPQTFDPNATIRATSIDLNAAAAERPTSRDLPDPNATIIENYPATVALPRNTGPTTGPAGAPPNTSDISRPATPPVPPPPPPPVMPPPAPPTPAAEPPRATTGEIAAPASGCASSVRAVTSSGKEEVEDAMDYCRSASVSLARRWCFGRRVLLRRQAEVGRDGRRAKSKPICEPKS